MDAINDMLQNPRVLYSDIKNVCGAGTKSIRESTTLLTYARRISVHDFPKGYIPSDEELIKEYGIICLEPGNQSRDYTIDRRIAFAIALTADKPRNDEVAAKKLENVKTLVSRYIKYAWEVAEHVLQVNNPVPMAPIEGKKDAIHDETSSDQFTLSEARIPALLNVNQNEEKMTIEDRLYFPKETKITKPCKVIADFLIAKIAENINVLRTDNMISINSMINATGLSINLNKWSANIGSEEYIRAVMRQTGKCRDDVFRTAHGGRQSGTWANIYIAFDIARWICPDFGIMVYSIVMDVMSGKLDIIPKIIDQHDRLNGTMTNLTSTAPAAEGQIRQTTVLSAEIDAMAAEQIEAQEKINASQAAFNHKLMRGIDYSKPVPRGELMKRDPDSGALVIQKSVVNKTNVERALVTMYPEMFYEDNITTMHDLIEEMWYKIVYLENGIARANINMSEDQPGDAKLVAEQKIIIKQLRVHIDHLTSIHRLKPLIEQLTRPRGRRPARNGCGEEHDDGPNVAVIYDLLNEVFSGGRIRQDVVDQLNWHMTSKLGCEFKTHVDFRNLVAVVSDMTDILRADLSARDFNPVVTRDFGNIFVGHDEALQSDWSPSYYHNILAEVSTPWVDDDVGKLEDMFSDSESVDPLASSGQQDAGDPYSSVSMHVPKTKRSSAPTRSRVAKRAIELGDELRTSILKVLEDRVNSIQPVVSKSRDEQMLNLYIGQEGYAFNIVPKISSPVPRLILAVTYSDIIEAGAFHLRPCGQISLIQGATSLMALKRLVDSNLPHSSKVGPAIFTLSSDYVGLGNSPIKRLIQSIILALQAKNVTSITYASDLTGQLWTIATPHELMA